jgi:chemotaxis protein histidine kinase CheA
MMARDTTKDSTLKPKIEAFADHHVITPPNTLRRAIRRTEDRERDDPVARAEAALANLSGEFKTWMAVECDRLAAAHAAILKNGFDAGSRDELFRAAHDIKGDAATFGFPTAGVAAESLCRIIEHAPHLDRVPPDLIAHHIQAIQAIVREHARIDAVGVADELSRNLRGIADEYLAEVNKDRPEHLDAVLAPSIAPAD